MILASEQIVTTDGVYGPPGCVISQYWGSAARR